MRYLTGKTVVLRRATGSVAALCAAIMLSSCSVYEASSPPAPVHLRKTFSEPERLGVSMKLADENDDGVLEVGERGVLRVTVRNGSLVTAREVRLLSTGTPQSAVDANAEMRIGDIPGGEERSCEIPVRMTQTGSGQVVIMNMKVVEKSGNGPSPVSFLLSRPPAVEVDVDASIPAGAARNPNAIAVLIGISRYKDRDVPDVEFASHDARIMKEYCCGLLGVPLNHVIELYDDQASLSAFKKVFEQQLKLWTRAGLSDVYVYYSGHGAPDPGSRTAYFVPWDCEPAYARSTGYAVSDFYAQLQKLGARSVTVFTDACFSGMSEEGTVLQGISPIVPVTENPLVGVRNGVAFASAASDQVSGWYRQMKHGLFTYFLMKGMRGDADTDGDGELTFDELKSYVTAQVSETSRFVNGREQTPVMSGEPSGRALLKY